MSRAICLRLSVAARVARACRAGFARTGHRGFAPGPAHSRRRRIVRGRPNQGSVGLADDGERRRPHAKVHSATGNEEAVAQSRPYQLPYLPTIPRQIASRSRAKGSLPTLAFFAAAVITITSFSSGSTKIDCP